MGITLGLVWLPQRALVATESFFHKQRRVRGDPSSISPSAVEDASPRLPLVSRVDYRLVLLGSLLPDIIDKPVGLLILGNFFKNGRIFCHTLLFSLLILVAGSYGYGWHRSTSLLWVGFGSLTHLVLDEMWRSPRTLALAPLWLGFPQRGAQ
jgi:hypothetical protein